MKPNLTTLGERLKHAREKKRYTQIEVAKMLDISNGAISGYERNYRDPDTDTLNKLATLYEVTPNWLLGRQEKDAAELLIEFLEQELSNEEIINRMNFTIDGSPLTFEEASEFVDFVRVKRLMKKQQPAAAKSEGL